MKRQPRSPPDKAFARTPIRRLVIQQGAELVARKAVDLLIDHLENTITFLTKQAKRFTKHAKRSSSSFKI